MTTQAILDSLRRSPDSVETWNEAAADLGALLGRLTRAELRVLADGLARIARDLHVESVSSCARTMQAVVRGAVRPLADAIEQELSDHDLRLMKDSAVEIVTALLQLGAVARHKDLSRALGWPPSRLTEQLPEVISAGMVDELRVGLAGQDKRAKAYRLLPLGRRLVALRNPIAVPGPPPHFEAPTHEPTPVALEPLVARYPFFEKPTVQVRKLDKKGYTIRFVGKQLETPTARFPRARPAVIDHFIKAKPTL